MVDRANKSLAQAKRVRDKPEAVVPWRPTYYNGCYDGEPVRSPSTLSWEEALRWELWRHKRTRIHAWRRRCCISGVTKTEQE